MHYLSKIETSKMFHVHLHVHLTFPYQAKFLMYNLDSRCTLSLNQAKCFTVHGHLYNLD